MEERSNACRSLLLYGQDGVWGLNNVRKGLERGLKQKEAMALIWDVMFEGPYTGEGGVKKKNKYILSLLQRRSAMSYL